MTTSTKLTTPLCPETVDLLDKIKASGLQPYQPEFAIETCDTGWWVLDKKRKIAYVDRRYLLLDALEFSPFESLGRTAEVHPCYDMGTRMNMHAMLLPAIPGNGQPPEDCTVNWTIDSGPMIRLNINANYPAKHGGQTATYQLTIDYDEDIRQYRYEIDVKLVETALCRREFCNFYGKGLGEGQTQTKNWQYTYWTGLDGKLRKLPHNPALTFCHCTHCRGDRNISPGGFIGFGVEADFNPVFLLLESNIPIDSHTCDMWHDEHICFDQSILHCSDNTGGLSRARFRVLDVPRDVVVDMLSRARPPHVSAVEIEREGAPAFLWGQVNDHETAADPHLPMPGRVWCCGSTKSRWLRTIDDNATDRKCNRVTNDQGQSMGAWDMEVGHSGTRSLRLQGIGGKTVVWLPAGHAWCAEAGQKIRFSAWIKTQDATASIRLASTHWTRDDEYAVAQSQPVSSDDDWQYIETILTHAPVPYVEPSILCRGSGVAWFDDLLIEFVDM